MSARWPIRTKLWVGLCLLLAIVGTLFGSASYGLYGYRGLVKDLSARSTELPLADELSHHVADLRITLSKAEARAVLPRSHKTTLADMLAAALPSSMLLRDEFRDRLYFVEEVLDRYRRQLDANRNRGSGQIGDDQRERETLAKIDRVMGELKEADTQQDWFIDTVRIAVLDTSADDLQQLASKLPSHLHDRLHALASNERAKYRTAIVLAWTTLIGAVAMLGLFFVLFARWIAKPLGILVEGSRRVAKGQFEHQIRLEGKNEMTELAAAMNAMTTRFRETRDDLDRQVRERTKQVVRSEQLASVGFLAAGVAHEINNPLASIAMCSESLDSRLADVLPDDPASAAEREVVLNYVQMIQEEAFRCKQITEQLLDFSRMGDMESRPTDLRELTESVIEMVRHLGKYEDKRIELAAGQSVMAELNAQEMKQVVLNLITNALDSVDPQGVVRVDVRCREEWAELIVEDDGCGMTDDVIKHLFEPFFTRSRGGRGTGLGLSITYRIVSDHNGQIEATSPGPGNGSTFVVTMPFAANLTEKEPHHQYQAA